MKFSRAFKVMLTQEGLTQKKLAAAAGYKTVSAISTPLAKEDIMLSTLTRLAKAAGYSVCLVKDGASAEEYPPIRIDPKEYPKAVHEPILKDILD